MSKILCIKANPKPDEQSNTFRLANEFLEEYKKNNPQDEIVTLDLYKEGIKPLDSNMLNDMFSGKDNEMLKHANTFASVDKYIIAAPMWNLSIPSILKSYFDYVTYVGVTFKYTENGPVGLLADRKRKAVHITTRGGDYSEGAGAQLEMGDRYIRTILGFMGVSDVSTLKLELANVLQGEELEKARSKSNAEARELAKQF